jgi:hypothetical protein
VSRYRSAEYPTALDRISEYSQFLALSNYELTSRKTRNYTPLIVAGGFSVTK